jgi:proteasome lid subunit RPN8/RPN11
MIGGLSAALVLATLSLLYTNLGIIGFGLILALVLFVVALWGMIKRRKYSFKPSSSIVILSSSQTERFIQSQSDITVKCNSTAMESMFYKAATFKHEVGGMLLGTRAANEFLIKRVRDGFETDLSNVELKPGERIVGYWHSHARMSGTFLSGIDEARMKQTPEFISVIVSPSSESDAIAAYGIVDGKVAKLRVLQQ